MHLLIPLDCSVVCGSKKKKKNRKEEYPIVTNESPARKEGERRKCEKKSERAKKIPISPTLIPFL